MKPFSVPKRPTANHSQDILLAGLWHKAQAHGRKNYLRETKGAGVGKRQETTDSRSAEPEMPKMTDQVKDEPPSDQRNTRQCPGMNWDGAQILTTGGLGQLVPSIALQFPNL